MIDVIIPAYNSHDTIDITLSSLSLQSFSKNIKVLIVNDGSSRDYEEYVSFYKDHLNIKELSYKNNMGPGYAREYGIEHSNSKYIMFIDSDDCLYDFKSIEKLYNAINEGGYDIVNSIFCEYIDGEVREYLDDVVWLHGKIYKRDFIEKNNIKFNNSRSNEDNGFNTLLRLNKPKEKYLEEVTYVWNNNIDSITRRNNREYKYTGLLGYIYNMTWALNQKKDNKDVSRIALAALYFIYLRYIEFDNKKDIDKIIKESKKLYDIYQLYSISDDEKYLILSMQFDNLYKTIDKKVLLKPYISFYDFLEKVGDKND